MAKDNKKVKVRKLPFIILGVIILAIVIVLAIVFRKKPVERQVGIDVQNMGYEPQSVEEQISQGVATVIDIDLEDCSVVLGQNLLASATVTPADTAIALKWTSSDTNVFTVDDFGVVTTSGVGTAALTATIGNVSDAIVIEVLKSNGDSSALNLQQHEEQETEPATAPAQSTVTTPTQQPTTIAPTIAEVSKGMRTADVTNSLLSDMGFSRRANNVYIFGESGSDYQGEVIVQSDCVIIYLKQRTSEYEGAVMELLKDLLPEKYTQVWSNYTSAASDVTFTAEGRTVRIVTASKGGHSQIVIYN